MRIIALLMTCTSAVVSIVMLYKVVKRGKEVDEFLARIKREHEQANMGLFRSFDTQKRGQG